MDLSKRLRAARLKRGLSQQEVGKPLGFSQPYVSLIESGDRTDPHARKALADALGVKVTVEELLSR